MDWRAIVRLEEFSRRPMGIGLGVDSSASLITSRFAVAELSGTEI